MWDDGEIDWDRFDVVLIRSTWDYVERIDAFRAWIERRATRRTLRNPVPALRWSLDKRYLDDLADAGLPITPTVFVGPGETLDSALPQPFGEAPALVVKPTISAGSRDTQRYAATDRTGIDDHVRRLTERGATAMVQPYLDRVDDAGETALIYLGGRFSHAIRKGPILVGPRTEVAGLYAAETIDARVPSEAEIGVADRVNRWLIERFGRLVFARIDLLPSTAGPVVLEVELIEPSLFLDTAPASAARLVEALDEVLDDSTSPLT